MNKRLLFIAYLIVLTAAIYFAGCGHDILSSNKSDDWPFDTTTYTGSGDVNLNGNPYEIADVVVFTNYFIYGINAFTVSADSQISATDVNRDGRALTTADLVYMIRHILGDGWNWQWLKHNSFTAKFDGHQRISTNAQLGAVFFKLLGNANVELGSDARNMELMYHFDGVITRVLIYSFEKGQVCSGEILVISGADVVHIDAASYIGNSYKTEIVDWRNNIELGVWPNPFYPKVTIGMGFPADANWSMKITDMSGRIAAEFEGYTAAGTVEIEWNATNQPDGIYLCEVTVGEMNGSINLIVAR